MNRELQPGVASATLEGRGPGRALTFSSPQGPRMRFWSSSVSCALWMDPAWRREDADFVARALPPGGTFVDVGANVGQLTLAGAAAVGPGGLDPSVLRTQLRKFATGQGSVDFRIVWRWLCLEVWMRAVLDRTTPNPAAAPPAALKPERV